MTPKTHGPYTIPWADLLKRVFGADVLTCAKCSGPMQVIAYIHDRDAVGKAIALAEEAPDGLLLIDEYKGATPRCRRRATTRR